LKNTSRPEIANYVGPIDSGINQYIHKMRQLTSVQLLALACVRCQSRCISCRDWHNFCTSISSVANQYPTLCWLRTWKSINCIV